MMIVNRFLAWLFADELRAIEDIRRPYYGFDPVYPDDNPVRPTRELFTPFQGFDPLDGAEGHVVLSRGNPCAPKAPHSHPTHDGHAHIAKTAGRGGVFNHHGKVQ